MGAGDYFHFLDKTKQVVAVSREENILISCVNPSGMGFRKSMMTPFSDKIYAETAHVVKAMKCSVKKLAYDSVAVRLHEHNQALDKKYYRHSILKNWEELLGNNNKVIWDFRANFICMKNRAGMKYLLSEIRENVKIQPRILLSPSFWLFSVLTIIVPAPVLKWMGDIYRKTRKVKPKRREYGPIILNLGAGRKLRTDANNVDALRIGVSTRSACATGSLRASHVLLSIGLSHADAQGTLVISIGIDNTEADVIRFLKSLKNVETTLRDISPLYKKASAGR